MLFNKTIYQIHKWVGLIGGVILLIISITGCLLTFSEEIDNTINDRVVYVTPDNNRKSYDKIFSKLRLAFPNGKITNLRIYNSSNNQSYKAEVRKGKEIYYVYINPYTAEIIKSVNRDTPFMRVILNLHRRLLSGIWGQVILFLTGICLFISAVTGIIYYRKSLVKVFTIGLRSGKGKKIFYSDIHKLVGVSAFLFILLISCTGIYFHWVDISKFFFSYKKMKKEKPIQYVIEYSLDSCISKTSKIENFRPEIIQFPQTEKQALRIMGKYNGLNPLLGLYSTYVDIDSKTGKLLKLVKSEDRDSDFKIDQSIKQLHYGKFGGFITKIIYFLFAVTLFVSIITGFFIYALKKM